MRLAHTHGCLSLNKDVFVGISTGTLRIGNNVSGILVWCCMVVFSPSPEQGIESLWNKTLGDHPNSQVQHLPPLEPAVPSSEIITSSGGLCQETQQCPGWVEQVRIQCQWCHQTSSEHDFGWNTSCPTPPLPGYLSSLVLHLFWWIHEQLK